MNPAVIASQAVITAAASASAAVPAAPEIPAWVSYVGDAFFIVAFLIIWLFFKPDETKAGSENALSEEEQPNPLEAVLVTDEPQIEQDEQNSDPDSEINEKNNNQNGE